MQDLKHYARDLKRQERKQNMMLAIVILLALTVEPLTDVICSLF